MLSGRRAFARPTSAETVAAILSDELPRASGSARRIPAELDRLVAHCLEKKPHHRFQSARDLAFHLRAIGTRNTAAAETSDDIDSLAVLPFLNAADNPDAEYLSDGIAESLINSLSQMPNLRVVPRSKAFRYKGQDVDAKKVGRQLKVRALLTGRIFQRGDTLNVQTELVDVARECQLWGERFQRKMADIFTVEEEIATQISERLRLKLTGQDRKRLLKRHTENTEAYHLYLKGRLHWNRRTGEGLRKAVDYFQQAIDKDSNYAMAYAGLADGYLVLSFFVPDPRLAFAAKGKAAALRALEVDAELAEAYTALGVLQSCMDWDWAGAERSMLRAIELKPEYWLAHTHYGMVLSGMGRHDEAVREVRRGQELEPLSLVVSHHSAWIHIRARRYDEAIDQSRKAVEMDPNFGMGHFWLGLALGLKGLCDEAIPELETATQTVGTTFTWLELARAYAKSGRTDDARKLLVTMRETFDRNYAEPFGFAALYAALNQPGEAFAWLEQAAQDRSGFFALWLNGDARLDLLQADPRMKDLLRRTGHGQGIGAGIGG
jgi:TolB-like protein